jgi:glycine/D-amino acid oxidase-like deaminating enzyme
MMSWPTTPPSALYAQLSRETFEAAPLSGMADADVAVIGGGIGGLSAALHLRQAGLSTVVLEARAIGAGASGRNNGQVIPTLTRHDPAAILNVMGPDRGERFLRMLQDSADLLFNTAARYGIDCDARRDGWFQPAHSPGRARLAAARAQQWQERVAPAEGLDAAALAEHLGSDVYYGGWRHGGGGHINPLAFARGLARAVRQEGGRIHENSPVLSMRHEANSWRLRTPQGDVRCRRVVMVTAAHTGGLWPGLASTIVPVTSYQLATAPLPPEIAARILPHDEAASDTRFDLRYFRKDRDGRLVTGGALAIQLNVQPRLEALVGRKLAETFPFLGTPAFPYFWGGRIAMTVDRLPRLHRTADGLIGWIGCNGRGLALAMGMGAVMRDAVLGVPDDQLALEPSPIVPVPMHPIVRRFARLALLHYRRKDSREVG